MKSFLPTIKLTIVAIILAIGASYVSAQTATPPGANLPPPVHRLSGSQVKDGSLSVNGFLANQNALFDQDVFINGIIKGTYTPSDTTSTVRIGAQGQLIDSIATGNIENKLTLGSDTLKNTTNRTVCGSSGGRVVFCSTGPQCGNNSIESGEQCDDGNTTNGDGCSSSCQTETAPVDLCPDATNPNPLFQGMQTTLPPGGVIINGKCKIKISASVAYYCSASSSQGAVQYTMNFDRPVPEDMMIYVAHTRSGTYNNCTGFPNNQCNHLAFTSTYYGFQFPPLTKAYDGDGLFINLTQGMTAHTTPFPKLSNGIRESNYQDSLNQQACSDHMAQEYKTSGVYFKVSANDPDIYITDFRLSNYTPRNPNLQFFNQ